MGVYSEDSLEANVRHVQIGICYCRGCRRAPRGHRRGGRRQGGVPGFIDAAVAGDHAALAPVNNDVQADQIANSYLDDAEDVAEAKAKFAAAFEDAAAGGLAALQAPAPVHIAYNHVLPAAPYLAGYPYNGLAYNGLAYNGLAYNGLAYNGLVYNGLVNGLHVKVE